MIDEYDYDDDTGLPKFERLVRYVKIAGDAEVDEGNQYHVPGSQPGDICAAFSPYPGDEGVILQLCRLFSVYEERPITPRGVKAKVVERWRAKPRDAKWDDLQQRIVRKSTGNAVSECFTLIARCPSEPGETEDDAIWRFNYLPRKVARDIARQTKRSKIDTPDDPKPAPLYRALWRVTVEKTVEDPGTPQEKTKYEFRFALIARTGEPGGPSANDLFVGAEIRDETRKEIQALRDPDPDANAPRPVTGNERQRGSTTITSGPWSPPPPRGEDDYGDFGPLSH